MIADIPDLAELIRSAQVQGLSGDDSLPAEARQIIGAADKERRQLSQEELLNLCAACGQDASLPLRLQNHADDLVNQARCHLLEQQPQLVQHGGALYPSERADACWRDCWNFLRVIVYAVACQRSNFTNPRGMAALRDLYRRMRVPMEGLNIALSQLKVLAAHRFERETDQVLVNACFQHLLEHLNKTAVKS